MVISISFLYFGCNNFSANTTPTTHFSETTQFTPTEFYDRGLRSLVFWNRMLIKQTSLCSLHHTAEESSKNKPSRVCCLHPGLVVNDLKLSLTFQLINYYWLLRLSITFSPAKDDIYVHSVFHWWVFGIRLYYILSIRFIHKLLVCTCRSVDCLPISSLLCELLCSVCESFNLNVHCSYLCFWCVCTIHTSLFFIWKLTLLSKMDVDLYSDILRLYVRNRSHLS